MVATVRHFAIHADDVERARRFHEGAFGWRFEPWGPPGFDLISGAGVGDLGAIVACGGAVTDPPFRIDGVGELACCADTEGNRAGGMQYEAGFFAEAPR